MTNRLLRGAAATGLGVVALIAVGIVPAHADDITGGTPHFMVNCNRYVGPVAMGNHAAPRSAILELDATMDTYDDRAYTVTVNGQNGSVLPARGWFAHGPSGIAFPLPDTFAPVSVHMVTQDNGPTIDKTITLTSEEINGCGLLPVKAPVITQKQVAGLGNDLFYTPSGIQLTDGQFVVDGQFGYQLAHNGDGVPDVEVAQKDGAFLIAPNGYTDSILDYTFTDNGQTPTHAVVTKTTTYPAKTIMMVKYDTWFHKGQKVAGRVLSTNKAFTTAQRSALAAIDNDNALSIAEWNAFLPAQTVKFGTLDASEVTKAGSWSKAVVAKYGIGTPSANVTTIGAGQSFWKVWTVPAPGTTRNPFGTNGKTNDVDLDVSLPQPVVTATTTNVANPAPAVVYDTFNKPTP